MDGFLILYTITQSYVMEWMISIEIENLLNTVLINDSV